MRVNRRNRDNEAERTVSPSPMPSVFRLRCTPLTVPAVMAAFWERKYAANVGP
jgi:hypothetical protein